MRLASSMLKVLAAILPGVEGEITDFAMQSIRNSGLIAFVRIKSHENTHFSAIIRNVAASWLYKYDNWWKHCSASYWPTDAASYRRKYEHAA